MGDGRKVPVTAQGLDPGSEVELDAVVSVQLGEHRSHLRTEHPLERHRRRLDEGDLLAEQASRSGDLGADPARADDDQPGGAAQREPQRVGVGERAQVVHTAKVGAGEREAPRRSAGGEQQAVIAEGATPREDELARREVEGGGCRGGEQLDALLLVEVGVVHGGGVEVRLPAEVALRERGSFVGAERLLADQHHAAIEAARPQLLRSLGAREAGADDRERLLSGGHFAPGGWKSSRRRERGRGARSTRRAAARDGARRRCSPRRGRSAAAG